MPPTEHMDTSSQMMHAKGAIIPGVPSARDGSGTSWLPDLSSHRGWHWTPGSWMTMLHGMATLRYTTQDVSDAGSRGDEAVDGPNWAMLMANRPAGRNGQLSLRGMFSLDPLTEGGGGYPLLFQSGETWNGVPLVDHQHPHDFLMELSAAYGHRTGDQRGLFAYFGLPGEPALGPTAFMHRPSAQHMLDAPLGHHWQDASHIAFGVVTGGFVYDDFKLDASVFTGREPDENRWNIDTPRFDSYSARASFNPTRRLALQASAGSLHSPEALEPDIDVTRTTASALYHHPMSEGRAWTSALVWGLNTPSEGPSQHSFLVESDLQGMRLSPFGRAELVQKSAHDLGVQPDSGELFDVAALSLGLATTLFTSGGFALNAAVQGSVYHFAPDLGPEYGDRPWSVQFFLQLLPAQRLAGPASTESPPHISAPSHTH